MFFPLYLWSCCCCCYWTILSLVFLHVFSTFSFRTFRQSFAFFLLPIHFSQPQTARHQTTEEYRNSVLCTVEENYADCRSTIKSCKIKFLFPSLFLMLKVETSHISSSYLSNTYQAKPKSWRKGKMEWK